VKIAAIQADAAEMITRLRSSSGRIEVRRFRIDAFLIAFIGFVGGGFLLFLVSTTGLDPVAAVLPMLLAVAASILGIDTLYKRGREFVCLDLEKKILTARAGRATEGAIPFNEIEELDVVKGSFLNLRIIRGRDEFILFESFLFSPRIYRFCALLRDAGIPVSPALHARLSSRVRAWKMVLVMLLLLWLAGSVSWLLLRNR